MRRSPLIAVLLAIVAGPWLGPVAPAGALSTLRPWWQPVSAPLDVGVGAAGPGIVQLVRTTGSTVAVTLRAQGSGDALWSASVQGTLVTAGRVPGGILTFTREGGSTGVLPAQGETARLALLEDGEAAWSRTFVEEYHGLVNNGLATLSGVLEDADGDGHPDPVISLLDRRPAGVTRVTALVVSGRTGADLGRVSVDGIRNTAIVVPASDIDGDGRSDVFLAGVVSLNATEVLRLAAIRGSDGAAIWTRDVTRPPAATFNSMIPIGDGNGDGRDDLLVTAPASGTQQTSSLVAYSGADGTTLWSRPFAGAAAHAEPLWNGDVLVGSVPPAGSGAVGINLSRLDGRTGVHRWDRAYTLPGDIGSTDWRMDWGDADGDGIGDAYVAIATDAPEVARREWLVSGATGDPAWSKDHGEGERPVIQTFRRPVGRDRGQGLWFSTPETRGNRLTVVDGPTGVPLWDRAVTEPWATWAAADADGDGVGDVLVATGTGLQALDGRDGSVLWTTPA